MASWRRFQQALFGAGFFLVLALCTTGAVSVYTFSHDDLYIPDTCEKVAKGGDHILLTYTTLLGNGTAGPAHPAFSQPLHAVLEPRDEYPLHQAIKGMCQNATRRLKWDSLSMLHGVALTPIIGLGRDVLDLEMGLTMDVHVEAITDTTDYQIFDAFRSENISKVLDLIEEHVGINALDEYGQTPLMMAVSKQYLPVVASLLNARRPKVDVNMAKSSGFTAVFYAVEKATPTILQALLRRGADPNVVILQSGSRGNTPLHYACMLEKTKHAELLLEYGADPTATNEHGQMPLQLLPADAVRSTKLSLKNLFEAAYNKIQAAKVKQLDQAPSFSSPASGGSARTDM